VTAAAAAAPTAPDLERRCAPVRTLWAHLQARDWLTARAMVNFAADALADGRVHSVVEVTQAAQRFFANSRFRFDAALRIVEVEEYWATVESPPAWRSAAAIGAYQHTAAETSA